MTSIFPTLNDDAALWVWISSRRLNTSEREFLLERLRTFTASWTSHGRKVHGETHVVEDRILLIAGDVDSGDISGCGIDKSVHVIDAAAAELGFDWISGLEIVYRRPGSSEIETAERSDFRRMAEGGKLDPQTVIYDRSPTTLGALRSEGLAKTATETWTARYFGAAGEAVKLP